MNDEHIKEIVNKMLSIVFQPELDAAMATKQDIIQKASIPTASADEVGKLYQFTGLSNGTFYTGHWYLCIDNESTYSWKDVTDIVINRWYGIKDYPTYIYNQDKLDDMLAIKTGPMLRTDMIVANQNCFGLTAGNTLSANLKQMLGANCTGYKYFYWDNIESTEGNYDFSPIAIYLQGEYSKGRRSGLRLFINTGSKNDNPAQYTINGVTYKSHCPEYIVQIMANSTKPKYYAGDYILTDWNETEIRTAYKNLIAAFGTWLNDENSYFTVGENEDAKNILYKDLVAYVDMGLMGQWGEGARGNWRYNECTVDDMVEIYQQYLTSMPDVQCNIGQGLEPYSSTNVCSTVWLKVKNKSNNAGYVGFYLDNVGCNNRIYRDDFLMDAEGHSAIDYFEKFFIERGDFFTGEFQSWEQPSSIHGDSGIYALKSFLLFKAPHFRISNFSLVFNVVSGSVDAKKMDKKVYMDYVRALSCVGARFVVSPLRYTPSSRELIFKITNIGLTAPRFDYYNVKIRITNLDNGETTDVDTNIDLTTMPPRFEPLLYMASNGYMTQGGTIITLPEIAYTNYSISVIAEDKLGFKPMYFSNYDRAADGSYLLCTVKDSEVTYPIQELNSPSEQISAAESRVYNATNICANDNNDYYYTTKDTSDTWNMLFTYKYYDPKEKQYVDTPNKNYPIKTFARTCKPFQVLVADHNNNQVSYGDSIVFLDVNGAVLSTARFSAFDSSAEGEMITVPFGATTVQFSCANANSNILANNRVYIKNVVIVPKNVTANFTEMPTASADLVGRTVMYMGTTDANYTHGTIYECKETETDVYGWVSVVS